MQTPQEPSTTNLFDLLRRFDVIAAVVGGRIANCGQDPGVVLVPRPSQFRLQLLTGPGTEPKYWSIDLRLILETGRTNDEIADDVIRLWRREAELDS